MGYKCRACNVRMERARKKCVNIGKIYSAQDLEFLFFAFRRPYSIFVL